MKKLFTLIATAFVSVSAMAQQFNSFVSHDSKSTDVRWSINLMGMGAVNSNNSTSIEFGPSFDKDTFVTTGFYFGISNLATNDFDLKPGSSLEFGFSPLDFALWNRSGRFGLITNLTISWTRYKQKHDDVFIWTDGTIDGAAKGKMILGDKNDVLLLRGINDYSNPRMTYASWRIPVELAVSNANHNWLITAGVEGEFRHHLRQRVKYGKNKKYYLSSHDMGVNPFGVNAVASIGFKGTSIFGRVSLTDFFDKDYTNLQATPFMVGIRFYNN